MKITTDSTTLEKIFYGLQVRYSVPKYQRDYSWTTGQELSELWTDIINAYKTGDEYFMGTILLAMKEKDDEKFDIVDGQQRTVSFTLLLSVFQDIAKLVLSGEINEKELSVTSGDREAVAEELFFNVKRQIKNSSGSYLRVANKDSKYFEEMLDVANCSKSYVIGKRTNRIIKAKCFFREKVKDEFFGQNDSLNSLDKFYKFLITKLKFVTIRVEDDYDAYVIFEALNSKGLDLSVADLLKNKILSNLPSDSQDAALVEWDELVSKIQTTSSSFIDYIKIYWSAYNSSDVTKATLYKDIRKSIKNSEGETKELLNELSRNADSFIKLRNKLDSNWPKITSKEPWAPYIAELNLLGYTIHLPCFLYALQNKEDYVLRLAKKTLTLLFRWVTICDYGVGDIDAHFKSVLKDMKENKDINVIEEKFDLLIDRTRKSFTDSLSSYETESATILKYISCKCHIFKFGDAKIPNYLGVDLEHVLPKSTEEWEKDSAFNLAFTKPLSHWINNIGNVILLEKGKNRKIQNKSFDIKKAEFSTSDFSEAVDISRLKSWSMNEIEKRAGEISMIADEIWS